MSIAIQKSMPQLRLASLDDYDDIVRLESSNALQIMPREDWQNLWLNNPLWPRLGKDWPVGWALHDADERIVGSLVNIPSIYKFQGRDLICANGRSWVVAPEYRAFALALMDEYFNQPGADLFINTTVGAVAAPMIGSLSEPVPRGNFQQVAFRALVYRGLVKKALRRLHAPAADKLAYPIAGALRLKDALLLKCFPSARAGIVVEEVKRFDDRFDLFWDELVRQNPHKLLSERSTPALAWHFANPIRLGNLWIQTASRHGRLQAYCIMKRQDLAGPLRRMRLVDYQSLDQDHDLLPGLLRQALRRCVAEDCDVLENVGCGVPKMRSFERFAPYRRRLDCWSFFYRANDPALAAQLARPEVWDPSSYDGDASFD